MSDESSRFVLPKRSLWAISGFTRYTSWYLRRHFHAVRILRRDGSSPLETGDRPLIVYLNHPSWWDPLICVLLATRLLPRHAHYAVIDAGALQNYGILSRLGFLGVEAGTRRGAAMFLRSARVILANPTNAMWLTPQGQFADVRQRPVALQPGLAHLARSVSQARVVPVALEYVFWHQRTPEALVNFGEPLDLPVEKSTSVEATNDLLAARLQDAQDALAVAAIAQDAGRFATLLGGSAGIGGIYDIWRRARAWSRGEAFRAEHQL